MSGPRAWAIGDVHGCRKTLEALLDALGPTKADELIFLGDYIDRGPDSRGVLDLLMRLQDEGYQTVFLRGNHEQLLLDSCRDMRANLMWQSNGGDKMLAEFGVRLAADLPQGYLDFIEATALYHETGRFIMAHAGIDLHSDDLFGDPNILLWQRKITGSLARLDGRTFVHGHTPTTLEEVRRQVERKDPILCLDTGCVYAHSKPGMGVLTALELNSNALTVQPFCG